MALKYKVGDRVLIKSIDWYNENKDDDGIVELSTHVFIPEMVEHCGTVVTIKDVFEDIDDNVVYCMEEIVWDWTDEMIECKVIQLDMKTKSEDGLLDEYEELTDRAFKGGYEKCKSDIELNGFQLPEGYIFKDENGNVINATKIVLEKKKKEYPKTYEECAKELGYNQVMPKDHILGYRGTLLSTFQQLLICRDAYWKIAGDEMELGKPWEPNFTNDDEERYGIYTAANKVVKDFCGVGDVNTILTFPTEEMRDSFKENFDQDIEICKEFL